jgi:hypothetical protein
MNRKLNIMFGLGLSLIVSGLVAPKVFAIAIATCASQGHSSCSSFTGCQVSCGADPEHNGLACCCQQSSKASDGCSISKNT